VIAVPPFDDGAVKVTWARWARHGGGDAGRCAGTTFTMSALEAAE